MIEKTLIPILSKIKGNNIELNKVTRFVRSSKAFEGRRRKAYNLIIKYKKLQINK